MYISTWSSSTRRPRAAVRRICRALFLVLVLTSAVQIARAQDDGAELRLRLRRDFGYGSGAQIQGRFSLIVDGPEELSHVTFFIDDDPIAEDQEPPFRVVFNTSGYELGWHTLHAVGQTSDGTELSSSALQRQFVSGNASLIIVVAVVVLVVGFRAASHLLTRNKTSGDQKGYGMYGGAICPRCGRPFSRHWWAPNLIAGKFDRCPSCGKWHFSTRATPQMLASAERFARELDNEAAKGESGDRAQDKEASLHMRLEESRYEDD